ncbi:MAG: GAF domain-containing protein [Leptospirillia bacterium]
MSSLPPKDSADLSPPLPENWSNICESEPLSFSGMIQPHGALVQVDIMGKITHASHNIGDFLPELPACFGKTFPSDLLDRMGASPDQILDSSPGDRREMPALALTPGAPPLDAVFIRNSEGFLIELFLSPYSSPPLDPTLTLPFSRSLSLEELNQELVSRIRAITGFDRVMIYAFRDDGDGEVLAENKNPDQYGTYLGLRFPGSDIPKIARELYLKNPWRLIPKASAAPLSVRSLTGRPPDLSISDLRSVSPVHITYLANMGVAGSLSFPVIEGRSLWGLVACHSRSPRTLALETLSAARSIVKNYNMALLQSHATERIRSMDNLSCQLAPFREIFLKTDKPEDILSVCATCLSTLFKACGLVFFRNNAFSAWGTTPSPQDLEKLRDLLDPQRSNPLWHTVSLSRSHPGAGPLPVAGMMALKLPKNSDLWIFRPETLQEVSWGGNPHKPVETDGSGSGISPRQSFERWIEKRVGECLPWSPFDTLAALHLLRTASPPPGSPS